MNVAESIIRKLGGTRKAASILGRPASTIQSWKAVGVIPAKHQPEVLKLAREHGFQISPADFFPTNEPQEDAHPATTAQAVA